MTEACFELKNIPAGPCGDCILHLDKPEHVTGPLGDGRFLLQLWCPHRQSGAFALVRPGEQPIRWTVNVPVSFEVWPRLVASIVELEAKKIADKTIEGSFSHES